MSPTPRTTGTAPIPHDFDEDRVQLYSPEFAAEPYRVYAQMRSRYGSLVPVDLSPGVPATLVIGYHTALRILNDPDRFPADPRVWETNIPAGCPVKPMLEYRPNVLRTAGAEHARYRSPIASALGRVDLYRLHDTVEQIAIPLINTFCADGRCDVIKQYALPVTFATVNELLGCSPDLGQRVAAGIAALFDTVDAAAGASVLASALAELTAQKRATPGEDVTTRLIQHAAALDDVEMVQQLIPLYGAGIEPEQNLIANALLLMLTDDRFAAGILGGSLSTRDAVHEVLFDNTPIANFCMSYPRQPIMIEETWLPAHQPVLISLAACNTDPEVRGVSITANRSHLAFGAGPHTCPARAAAEIIAQVALDQLLDALPDIELGVPHDQLIWRPGPFHRALASLPVTFPPSPPVNPAPAHQVSAG
ncbi:cytochrome P450 [Nocardia carnea]|uniref:cytochrome P450 n=1 Tax=Nocardia carnea TaxID=37328 RepID=UPI00245700CD|nr:cytochrome P450 [Nocardia carnea]